MFYEMQNKKTEITDIENLIPDNQKQYIGFIDYKESKTAIQKFGFNEKLLDDLLTNKSMTLENHREFYFIRLNILNHKALHARNERVCIYISKNTIIFIYNDFKAIEKIIGEMTQEETLTLGFDRLLCLFFEKLTANEAGYLEKIEQEISNLENALITSEKTDCVKEIVSLRKKLMIYKQYYEQLLDILDELQENENDILNADALHDIKIFSGKTDRYYHNVLMLRDYVTQVREAYQAEVDIKLNNIMKIFTVITAIFLPLTLIVGWYGMNLKMPEYDWEFGYPVMIIISVIVVVFLLYYFKKHKWF